jgi:formimidoylglutamase
MSSLERARSWTGPSGDPRDEQFGDIVEGAALEEAASYQVCVVGEPYDGGVIGRKGAREGPAALRTALAATKTHHLDSGPVGALGDLGNVTFEGIDGSVGAVQDHVHTLTNEIHEQETIPLFLGGDNSLTYPNAAPLLDDGALGVLSLDAHLDCRAVDPEPSSGTPYRQLIKAGLDSFAVLGARHFETSTAYVDYAREAGATLLSAPKVCTDPAGAAETALDSLGDVDSVYVSLDMDVLDAAHAPAVSAPTPGGLTPSALFQLLYRLCRDPRLAGLEVVECAPPLSSNDRTARLGARAIAHALAAIGGGTE